MSTTVSRSMWRRLRDLAAEQRRSVNDLLNEWIAEKVGDPPQPPDSGTKGGAAYA